MEGSPGNESQVQLGFEDLASKGVEVRGSLHNMASRMEHLGMDPRTYFLASLLAGMGTVAAVSPSRAQTVEAAITPTDVAAPMHAVEGPAVAVGAAPGCLTQGGEPVSVLVEDSSHFRYLRPCHVGPRMYFQTEATFLSRRLDQAPTEFYLYNASNGVSGTNSQVDPGSLLYDNATGSILNLDWDVNTIGPASTAELIPDHLPVDQITASPRVLLGIVGPGGWGVQGRYWMMENSVREYGTLVDFDADINSNPGDMAAWYAGDLNMTSDFERFQTQIADLEMTRDYRLFHWHGMLFAGARYGEFDNVRNTTVNGEIRTGSPGYNHTNVNFPSTVYDRLLDTYHSADYDFVTLQGMSFHGVGPTFGVSGLRPITKRLSLFTSGRGSVLFGETQNYASVNGQMSSLFADDEETASQFLQTTDELYVAETQLGLQLSCPARWLNGRFFARGFFEYQFWRNSIDQAFAEIDPADLGDHGSEHAILETEYPNGVTTETGTVHSGIGTTQGSASVLGLDPHFDLIGFGIATGYVW
jgi:hypothetical protein